MCAPHASRQRPLPSLPRPALHHDAAARVVAADGHADPVPRVGAHAGPAAGAVPRGERARPLVDPDIAGRHDPALDSARHGEEPGRPEGRRGARAPVLPGHGLEALEGEGLRHELDPVRGREPVVVERGAGRRHERVPAAAAHPLQMSRTISLVR